MECSQPAAWTTIRSLLVASRVRPFQEDRPILTQPYQELRTWMVVWSGAISVFPTHSGNATASPHIWPTTWLCPAYLPSTNSIPAPIQPTIAMTTTHIHQLWLTRPPSMHSSSPSEDHPQAPVVTQQQQHHWQLPIHGIHGVYQSSMHDVSVTRFPLIRRRKNSSSGIRDDSVCNNLHNCINIVLQNWSSSAPPHKHYNCKNGFIRTNASCRKGATGSDDFVENRI